jgi:trk system potassium uptake protein TrkH
LFEAISAFGTVGLSTGITPMLSAGGKIVIMILMFIGRVGPLTLALMVGQKEARQVIRLPEEELIVG